MAGVDEVDLDAGDDGNGTVVADRLQAIERAGGVNFGIERLRGSVLGVALPVRPPGVFFLDARRVGQHQRAQLARRRRTEDAAGETLGHEPRQIAAVIEVRVREDNGIDPRRIDGKRPPVAIAQLLEPLEQAAVDQDAAIAEVEQMLGTGDGASGSEERQRWRHGSALYSEDSPPWQPPTF